MCNAGVMEVPTAEQINGIERHFVTNHLGHFLLTQRLLPQLIAAPQGRVVVVSSGAYKQAPAAGIEFDNLSGERDYEPRKAYGQSKLANYLFVRELARRLAGTRVTANALQPGVIMTNLGPVPALVPDRRGQTDRLDLHEERRRPAPRPRSTWRRGRHSPASAATSSRTATHSCPAAIWRTMHWPRSYGPCPRT